MYSESGQSPMPWRWVIEARSQSLANSAWWTATNTATETDGGTPHLMKGAQCRAPGFAAVAAVWTAHPVLNAVAHECWRLNDQRARIRDSRSSASLRKRL